MKEMTNRPSDMILSYKTDTKCKGMINAALLWCVISDKNKLKCTVIESSSIQRSAMFLLCIILVCFKAFKVINIK